MRALLGKAPQGVSKGTKLHKGKEFTLSPESHLEFLKWRRRRESVNKRKRCILKTVGWVLPWAYMPPCSFWATLKSVCLVAPEILQDGNGPSGGHQELPKAKSYLAAQGNITQEAWQVLVNDSSLPLLACKNREKTSIYEPGNWSSPDMEFANALVWTSQAPELWEL